MLKQITKKTLWVKLKYTRSLLDLKMTTGQTPMLMTNLILDTQQYFCLNWQKYWKHLRACAHILSTVNYQKLMGYLGARFTNFNGRVWNEKGCCQVCSSSGSDWQSKGKSCWNMLCTVLKQQLETDADFLSRVLWLSMVLGAMVPKP